MGLDPWRRGEHRTADAPSWQRKQGESDGYAISLSCRRAYSLVNLGHWGEGKQQYALCAEAPNTSALVRATCEYALRWQQARRGTLPASARGLTSLDGDIDDFWRDVQTKLHTLQGRIQTARDCRRVRRGGVAAR